MGKGLLVSGLMLMLIGAAWHWAPGLFAWFGKLPGDLRFQRSNSTVFVPLGSMLIISLVLNVIYYLLFRR